jgi:hypothetical protein
MWVRRVEEAFGRHALQTVALAREPAEGCECSVGFTWVSRVHAVGVITVHDYDGVRVKLLGKCGCALEAHAESEATPCTALAGALCRAHLFVVYDKWTVLAFEYEGAG